MIMAFLIAWTPYAGMAIAAQYFHVIKHIRVTTTIPHPLILGSDMGVWLSLYGAEWITLYISLYGEMYVLNYDNFYE